jgi:hypothetical protein
LECSSLILSTFFEGWGRGTRFFISALLYFRLLIKFFIRDQCNVLCVTVKLIFSVHRF